MKPSQWFALTLAVVVFGAFACFPFVHYFDFDYRETTERDEAAGTSTVQVGRWTNGFLALDRVREIRANPVKMSSGENANLNFPVIGLFIAAVAGVTALIYLWTGERSGKRFAIAWLGFALIGFCILRLSMGYIESFSARRIIFSVLAAMAGLSLLLSLRGTTETGESSTEPVT